MSDPETGRPIVAELGRPETAEETWARKDTARRARREHQTAFNLVLALIASLGIVLFLVAVVVRPDQAVDRSVDYRQVAQQADVSGAQLLVPDLPSSYTSNHAEYQSGSARGGRGVDHRPPDARRPVHRHAPGHRRQRHLDRRPARAEARDRVAHDRRDEVDRLRPP
ncbi:DUF4245 family protein [Curtobacterium sp. MCPF17_052]|uniref:DUF4245 family protein n=1 Tax=Curtobacterium sp. MCPF17_052 TaxID=2175655 RepID=UPI0024DFFC84|nr:DUF4245 family protein [Curtobacterium sp. MCPF17_052]WIB12001.1 DUF4245 family protein [Curtobacterium sp. MCPF17_052]